jgi:hypothetical protein
MDEAEVRKIAKAEANFAVMVNRDNQDGFNEGQVDIIKDLIRRLSGSGSDYTDEQAVKAVKDKLA